MSNDDQRLKELIKEKSKDGRISCSSCYEISEKHSYSLKKVGEMADEMDIKIVNCQLGCF